MSEKMVITNAPDGSMIRRKMTPEEKKRFERKQQRARLKSAPETAGVSEEGNLSPARRRLLKLQSGKQPRTRIRTVQVAGEEFYIRSLTFPELTRLGLLTPRDKNGLLDMSNADNLGSLTAAMLLCCVAADADDAADYFGSLAEAHEWVTSTDPQLRRVVGGLFNECLESTPDILPGANPDATPEQREALEKKDESGTGDEPES